MLIASSGVCVQSMLVVHSPLIETHFQTEKAASSSSGLRLYSHDH